MAGTFSQEPRRHAAPDGGAPPPPGGRSVNRTRRFIKAPKIYWSDTGLGLHLAAERSPRGAHLENLVLTDLMAWAGAVPSRPNVLHWRTATGAEVDFVLELPHRLLPMEVKSSRRVTHQDARHLRTFLADYPEAPGALLLYDGDEVFWVDHNILAVPWHRVTWAEATPGRVSRFHGEVSSETFAGRGGLRGRALLLPTDAHELSRRSGQGP